MSGGVDSSVSAALLKQHGAQVHGFFMKLPLPGVEEHLARVQAVAASLEIPLTTVAIEKIFSERVIRVFIDTYRHGSTPNPCIICNQQVKFGALQKIMIEQGMEKMATGHYARLGNRTDGQRVIRRGVDPAKDQSYFLCRLEQRQLDHMILPLGEKTKNEVYGLATKMNLRSVHGPESQDVCFLAGQSIANFFQQQGVVEAPGEIVTSEGRVIGTHKGLWHYTIGQRRGLGLPDATPWYVKTLDEANNRVIVCKNEELITTQALVCDVRWMAGQTGEWEGLVQVRGRQKPAAAKVEQVSESEWLIHFNKPQRAITPGQFAAFYDDDCICGSGVIVPQEKNVQEAHA